MEILKALNHKLTPEQAEPFFADFRNKLVMGGERSGKSMTGAVFGTCRSLDPKAKLIWLVGMDYSLTRPEFSYMLDMSQMLGTYERHNLPRSPDEPATLVLKTGLTIETKTARDPRKIAGMAPDGIIGCEVALWDYETFLRVMGRLAEKRGWSWLSGSFESSLSWVADMWRRWQGENSDSGHSFSIPSHSNLHIYPGGADDPEILSKKALYPHNRFMERFMGEPCPPAGLVFNEFDPAMHVRALDFDTTREVYLAIDPGWAGAYGVLAVQIGDDDTVYVIDEIYVQNMTHEEVVHLCQTRQWWKNVKTGAMDIAGSQHHAQESAMEVWKRLANITFSAEKVRIMDGTMRVYSFIRTNKLFVDPKCLGLLCEFGAGPAPFDGAGPYRYRTDGEGLVVSELPIDANNHSCKALAYLLIHLFGHVETQVQGSPISYIGGGSRPDRVLSIFDERPQSSYSYLKG